MIIKFLKKAICAIVMLYSFNLIAIKFGIVLPINYITIILVSLMDIPAMILLTFSLVLIF